MGQSDWTECDDVLDANTVKRGVSNGIARPNGGQNFVYGFHSQSTAVGAAALFCNLATFAPSAKGGSVRAAIQRGISGGPLNFAPFIFAGAQGPSVNDNAYMLGLEDNDPHHIVLRKGALSGGMPSVAIGTQGILLRSTATYAAGTWLHLRLDMIVNLNGDVLLQCFQSDLVAHAVTSPTWVAIPGCTSFIDDTLAVNSGSVPYTSGRHGFGFQTKDVTRRGYFDQLEIIRQN